MPQNPVSEFQIPSNDLSDIKSQSDNVHKNIINIFDLKNHDPKNEVFEKKVEKSADDIIERLNFIGHDIENARNKELDSPTSKTSHHLSDVRIFARDVSKTLFFGNAPRLTNREIGERQLIDEESKIGASIFGQTSDKNQISKFFLHGHNDGGFYDWYYYHEENLSSQDDHKKIVLHYEVRPEGVLSYKTGRLKAEYLSGEELDNFVRAAEIYHGFVMRDYSTEKISISKPSLTRIVLKNLFTFPDNNGKKAA